MNTIRGRLALWYALALGATMFVFALTIYLVQRSEPLDELDARAEAIAALLQQAERERGGAVVRDAKLGRNTLAPVVIPQLDLIPDYVIVLSPERELLYLSSNAQALNRASQDLMVSAARVSDAAEVGLVSIGPPAGTVRYYSRPVPSAGPSVGWVIAAASVADLALTPRRLLTAMLVTAPLILAASTLIGYLLVGRTLEPVERIVDEVEAISDGRSLHRRLIEPGTGDELARLTTTLNAMLARLERSFLSLRRFTADASHELKTPLTVLRSGVERAITDPRTPAPVLEVLEETLIEVKRMTDMVDSLLMLARADEGRAPLHLERVDVRGVLAEVVETAGLLGEPGGVEVTVAVPSDPLVLEADPSRIRQLLMNLLTNAVKYTPRGGKVTVDSTLADGQITINVRDTGIGIAPGDLPQIFDRFWRADAARSRTGERPGAGLGLAICKWIAEAHGGTITVQSRPGRGTTFTVSLPVAATHPAPEADAAPVA